MSHVRTQLPYTLLALVISGLLFFVMGLIF
jgi:hypothetical protein